MLTLHAQKRCQQRAIPNMVLDLLIDIGNIKYNKGGATIFYLSKTGKDHARRLLKSMHFSQTDHCLNAYLVMASDGSIITTGHLYKRI